MDALAGAGITAVRGWQSLFDLGSETDRVVVVIPRSKVIETFTRGEDDDVTTLRVSFQKKLQASGDLEIVDPALIDEQVDAIEAATDVLRSLHVLEGDNGLRARLDDVVVETLVDEKWLETHHQFASVVLVTYRQNRSKV